MATEMDGARGKTNSRVNAARVNATRLGFAPGESHSVDAKLYAWEQEVGPESLEPAGSWTEEVR